MAWTWPRRCQSVTARSAFIAISAAQRPWLPKPGTKSAAATSVERHGRPHGADHGAGEHGADEDPVPDPAREADEWCGDKPGHHLARRRLHLGGSGHQRDDRVATEEQDEAEQRGPDRAPLEGEVDRAAQLGGPAGADRLSDQRLGPEGETVERKGGDGQKLAENLVGGERCVALPGREKDEAGEGELQAARCGSGCRGWRRTAGGSPGGRPSASGRRR